MHMGLGSWKVIKWATEIMNIQHKLCSGACNPNSTTSLTWAVVKLFQQETAAVVALDDKDKWEVLQFTFMSFMAAAQTRIKSDVPALLHNIGQSYDSYYRRNSILWNFPSHDTMNCFFLLFFT
jgi:hypothetical protein